MGILQWLGSKLLATRAHPSHNTNWALYGFGNSGRDTHAGVPVNEDSAQGLTVVYACIRAIAETVASLPFHLYEKVGEDKRRRATDHIYYRMINKKPNPEMTDMVFRETMLVHLLTWGNFYGNTEIDKGTGKIKAIWPLRPDRMTPKRMGEHGIAYIYQLESGEERLLMGAEVLHIPGIGFDGLIGYSPIEKNKEAIGLAMAAEQYGSRFFKNDARPGIVLKHPGELSDPAQDRLRKNWEDLHRGLDNAHRLAILEEGMDITTIGIPPAHAQWIELRNFQLPEICRIYRVPPPIIGDLSRATFANVEELTRHFAIHCIRPWLERIEQAYDNKFLDEKEQEKFYTETLMDAMMRADQVARYNAFSTGRQWGWLSANDVRRLENMDAIEDGDLYLSPSNMIPSNKVEEIADKQANPPVAPNPIEKGGMGGSTGKGNKKESEKKEDDLDDVEERISESEMERIRRKITERQNLEVAFEPLFRSSVQRIVNREVLALEKAIGRNEQELRAFFDDLYGNKLPDYIRENYEPVLRAYFNAVAGAAAKEINDIDVLDQDFEEFLEDYAEKFVNDYIGSSQGQLENIVETATAEERPELLGKRLEEWKDKKVDKISSDQLIRASNAIASQVFFFSAFVTSVVWVTRGHNVCPFCRTLSGKVVQKDEAFVAPMEAIPETLGWAEQDSFADYEERLLNHHAKKHPPLHKGCRCSLAATQGKVRKSKKEITQAKIENATVSHKPVDDYARIMADQSELRVAQVLGKNALPFSIMHGHNPPFDVILASGGKPFQFLEVKTLTNQSSKMGVVSAKSLAKAGLETSGKLTVHPPSAALKAQIMREYNDQKFYIIGVDKRPLKSEAMKPGWRSYDDKTYDQWVKDKCGFYSGHKYYIREITTKKGEKGSYYIHTMQQVSEKDLAKMFPTPKGVQGPDFQGIYDRIEEIKKVMEK